MQLYLYYYTRHKLAGMYPFPATAPVGDKTEGADRDPTSCVLVGGSSTMDMLLSRLRHTVRAMLQDAVLVSPAQAGMRCWD
jgi:hypothetical protein